MSSNVGLATPRGSGTSGYVQRNLSLLKPRSNGAGAPYSLDAARGPKIRKPDEAILLHDRLRDIEVRVLELRDRLEEEGELADEEIDEACDALRERLVKESENPRRKGDGMAKSRGRNIKGYQVHELAEAKAVESEKLRRALGLKNGDGGGEGKDGEGDGNEHPMARQERRRREREAEKVRSEVEREGERDEDDVDRERSRERDRDGHRDGYRERARDRYRDRSP